MTKNGTIEILAELNYTPDEYFYSSCNRLEMLRAEKNRLQIDSCWPFVEEDCVPTYDTHWRDSTNPLLVELARRRASYLNPEMKNVDMEHDGSVTGYFIRAKPTTLRLRDIDGWARQIFTSGACVSIAWSLHSKTGLPLAIFDQYCDEEEWAGHMALQIGDDQFLDMSSTGIRTAEDIMNFYHSGKPSTWKSGNHPYWDWDSDSITGNLMLGMGALEQLVVGDFADMLIEKHNLI